MMRNSIVQDAEEMIRFIREKKTGFWSRERERRPIALFHDAARRVPAYRDFLRKHRVNPERVRTFKDFQLIPQTNKKNYLRQYPLEALAWDGSLKKPLVWTSTSGSTGEPFYFPRGHALDWEYSVLLQAYLEHGLRGTKGPTLVIIGFGMGVWIGGLITYQAFELAARRSAYPVSIITPGINKKEIFHALTNLSPHFSQTILVGYPPFLKDVLDEAEHEGMRLKKLHLRIVSAAEAYTEKFRDYIAKKAGIRNIYFDMLNIYGTADIGAMAWETPASILIRRTAAKNKSLFKTLFSRIEKTPTLAQYNPFFITFEAAQGDILLSGNNTIPLIRYAVGDHGGVFDFAGAGQMFAQNGLDIGKAARRAGLAKDIWQLPFVYVYERKDLSTTLYGLQVYPEVVKEVLIEKPHHKYFTGKLTLITRYDEKQNQYLEINLELRKNREPSDRFTKLVIKRIVENLRVKNSEYRELHAHLKERAHPKIVLWPAEHPKYFKPGVKQKWVAKE